MPKLFLPTVVTTAAPTATDDAADGYVVGQLWLNATTNTLYVCTTSTVGAAVWTTAGSGGGGGGTAASTTFTPAGTIAAINVQTAIQELDTDIQALGGGSSSAIRQLKHVVSTTLVTTTLTTEVNTGITATLDAALASASNKVRVRVMLYVSANSLVTVAASLKFNGTSITPAGRDCMASVVIDANNYTNVIAFEFLHSPGTTVAGTYEITFTGTAGTKTINEAPSAIYKGQSSISLEEIGAGGGGGGSSSGVGDKIFLSQNFI